MYIKSTPMRFSFAFRRPVVTIMVLIGIVAISIGLWLIPSLGQVHATNLPWWVWTLIPLLVIAAAAGGILMFRREHNDNTDISIRPGPR